MDGGETLVLFGVVIAALVCISGLMVRQPHTLKAAVN
jgi:hypothetical protein